MEEISSELQKEYIRLMELKFEKHKKLVLRTWLFVVLYTIAVFFILKRYVYYMTVEIDLFFVKFSYNVRSGFLSFTLSYLYLSYVIWSNYIKDLNMNWLNHKPNPKLLTNLLKCYCFLFNFFFIWPALFTVVSDFPFLGNFGKTIIGISPILFYFLRYLFVDIVGSAKIVRKIFKLRDVDVWNCFKCHEYILEKPICCCPNCGSVMYDKKGVCKSCGLNPKISDFDFPDFCPHCGVGFKYSRLKKHV